MTDEQEYTKPAGWFASRLKSFTIASETQRAQFFRCVGVDGLQGPGRALPQIGRLLAVMVKVRQARQGRLRLGADASQGQQDLAAHQRRSMVQGLGQVAQGKLCLGTSSASRIAASTCRRSVYSFFAGCRNCSVSIFRFSSPVSRDSLYSSSITLRRSATHCLPLRSRLCTRIGNNSRAFWGWRRIKASTAASATLTSASLT